MQNAGHQVQKKAFSHQIMTGSEKWIYCKNPKHKNHW